MVGACRGGEPGCRCASEEDESRPGLNLLRVISSALCLLEKREDMGEGEVFGKSRSKPPQGIEERMHLGYLTPYTKPSKAIFGIAEEAERRAKKSGSVAPHVSHAVWCTVWMCGGLMEDAPCSRVGHIYRKYVPYKFPGGVSLARSRSGVALASLWFRSSLALASLWPHSGLALASLWRRSGLCGVRLFPSSNPPPRLLQNLKRVAEVWMDEFAEFLYRRRPEYRHLSAGDVSAQKELRSRLGCRSFSWYMSQVAWDLPQHYPMVEPPAAAWGEVRSVASGLCMESKHVVSGSPVRLESCVKGRGEGSWSHGQEPEKDPNYGTCLTPTG
ncbi:Polypeptide N-acetylgalactosaminyltransferase 10 [Liparis tanakae]|uniref:Polypeptide N-acetylgalactosaminyltransferase 10 n=1 Tax=Liparis tanakae TaxID=230148 RepID=A0A4Z2IJS0_9TELE|nr:Polypeptide N-acetylgalactosaminyltransferase 10 [Liparis tanakae]